MPEGGDEVGDEEGLPVAEVHVALQPPLRAWGVDGGWGRVVLLLGVRKEGKEGFGGCHGLRTRSRFYCARAHANECE